MKLWFCILSACLLLLACEGKQGPMGPSGAAIEIVTGVAANDQYIGDWLEIQDDVIDNDAIVQVYINEDSDVWAWQTWYDFQVTTGAIGIYDPSKGLVGYEYMVIVIPNNTES